MTRVREQKRSRQSPTSPIFANQPLPLFSFALELFPFFSFSFFLVFLLHILVHICDAHVCCLNMSAPDALPWAHQTEPGADSQRREKESGMYCLPIHIKTQWLAFTATAIKSPAPIHARVYQLSVPCKPNNPQIDFQRGKLLPQKSKQGNKRAHQRYGLPLTFQLIPGAREGGPETTSWSSFALARCGCRVPADP